MSRLDDELKMMFQRREPSADFAERVLARIKIQAQPKESLWQRLLSFFQPTAMRWAVAATVVLLVAVIGFMQYQRLHQRAINKQQAGVEKTPSSDSGVVSEHPTPPRVEDYLKKPESRTTGGITQPTRVNHRNVNQHHRQRLKHRKETSVKNEEALATQQKSAGEIAKEQLMKALFIASATVNEAKKMAMGGDD
jgi:hypothetical protein